MTEDLARVAYEVLRDHDSFDYGTWEDLTPGQRAYVGSAAEAVLDRVSGLAQHEAQIGNNPWKAERAIIEAAKRALLTLQGPAGTPEQRIYAAATDLAKCLNALQEAEQQP